MARVDSTVGQIFDIFRPEKIVATVAQRIGDAGAHGAERIRRIPHSGFQIFYTPGHRIDYMRQVT